MSIQIENTSKKKSLEYFLDLGFSERIAKNILDFDIEVIQDSDGAKYMNEFMDDFPRNTLLDKGKTGIGATSMALKHKDKFVIAVPYRGLASNKKEWCEERDIKVLIVDGDTTKEEAKKFKGNKIIAVYDSLYKVSINLPNFESFRILIDEAHVLLLSGIFRKKAIYTVLNEYKKYKDFVFLTATIPSRMYEMENFKRMKKVVVKWKHNPQPTFLSHIIDPYNNEKLNDVLYAICIEHLKGKRSSNAYIFINSVKAIKAIIKLLTNNKEATHKDINIIAASSKESQIETDLGKEFSIGKPPRSTETAKKLNFITSTGFEGQDFYDSNGKVYIVSDGSFDFMKLDLLTQVPQIVGRLRNSELNNEIPIVLVPNKVDESQTIAMFKKNLNNDLATAKKDINERKRLLNVTDTKFDGVDKLSIERYLNFAKKVKEEPQYYVDNKNNISINKLYLHTNLNKWEVSQQGVLSVYNEEARMQQVKYSEVFEMNFKYEKSHNMPIEFIKYRLDEYYSKQSAIMKTLSLMDDWLNSDEGKKSNNQTDINSEFYAFYAPDWIKEACFTIGKDKMISLRYSEVKIKALTKEYHLHKSVTDKLNIEIGKWYSNPDLKNKIQKAYDSVNILEKAKAINISKYYNVELSMKTISKGRKHGYIIKSKITM